MEQLARTLQVQTNLSCNLNCTYCYEEKTGQIADIKCVDKYFEHQFKEFSKEKVNTIVLDLIGGEPFLVVDLLDEIIQLFLQYCKKYNIKYKVSTSTNFTILNDKVKKFIKKYKGLLHIGVSIDGVKEAHDECRIDKNGNPTYDIIIENVKWLMKNYCSQFLSIKSTYTTENFIKHYHEGVKNLINLGFRQIHGNIIFEETINFKDGIYIAEQMLKTIDYIFEKNLDKSIDLGHIYNTENIDVVITNLYKKLNTNREVDINFCGTGKYMRCLGFDGKIYSCHRFHELKGNKDKYVIDNVFTKEKNDNLLTEIKEIYKYYNELDDCKNCLINNFCPYCVAAMFENNDPKGYISEKRMCGWTHALYFAKSHGLYKYIEKYE